MQERLLSPACESCLSQALSTRAKSDTDTSGPSPLPQPCTGQVTRVLTRAEAGTLRPTDGRQVQSLADPSAQKAAEWPMEANRSALNLPGPSEPWGPGLPLSFSCSVLSTS